jgi:isopentenyl phosphate kinase
MEIPQFDHLVFLKLGGSLITDKSNPRTPRRDVIARLAREIRGVLEEMGGLRLVLGHGSGSFGHVPAKKYGTRQGVHSSEGWRGFTEVWYEAASLNRIVIEILYAEGLPVIAFAPSAGVLAHDGQVESWEIRGLVAALEGGLIPVVFGDAVFDQLRGGTILSTEDEFAHLARQLQPSRILLAGIDEGVWADFPDCTQLITEITPVNWAQILPSLGDSVATDVTGGMASKVREMLNLVEEIPGLEVIIFSGNQPGNVGAVLRGGSSGSRVFAGKYE